MYILGFCVQIGWVSQKSLESTSICHPFEKSVILNQFLRNESDVEILEKYLLSLFQLKLPLHLFCRR